VAHFPLRLESIVASPTALVWAGVTGTYLALIALEDWPVKTPEAEPESE